MYLSFRRRIVMLLAIIGLVAGMGSPVHAAKPIKEYVNESFDEVVCDIPVATTVTGFQIFHIQTVVIPETTPDADSFWIGVIQVHLTITSTNADGVQLTNQVRQTIQEESLVDNGDGTWTYIYAVSGKPLTLRHGNKKVLVDVGRIVFRDVYYFGDLSTVEDNEFISEEILSISGPHPQAESDFELFCEVFTEIMG